MPAYVVQDQEESVFNHNDCRQRSDLGDTVTSTCSDGCPGVKIGYNVQLMVRITLALVVGRCTTLRYWLWRLASAATLKELLVYHNTRDSSKSLSNPYAARCRPRRVRCQT